MPYCKQLAGGEILTEIYCEDKYILRIIASYGSMHCYDTTVGNLLVSFIMSSCGEKCQMTSIITRSKNEVHTMLQDGLTTVLRWSRLGIRYQHKLLFRNTIANFFDMPKIFPSLTMFLTKPYKLSQRSYDGIKCPHEWRDIDTIRTEFDFVLIRVSILWQYRDSVTPALRTRMHCLALDLSLIDKQSCYMLSTSHGWML